VKIKFVLKEEGDITIYKNDNFFVNITLDKKNQKYNTFKSMYQGIISSNLREKIKNKDFKSRLEIVNYLKYLVV
jgi:hypothetical protein